MKTVIFLGLLVASYVSTTLAAADCSAKFQQYRTCLQQSRPARPQHNNDQNEQANRQALKVKIDACFTSHSCAVPSNQGNHDNANSQCKKDFEAAYKQKVQACVQQSGVSQQHQDDENDDDDNNKNDKSSEEGGEGERGGERGFRYDEGALKNCPQQAAVKSCIQAAVKESFGGAGGAGAGDWKAKKQAFCAAKQQCGNQLGAECKAELAKRRKAACECRQQQDRDQIRSQVPSCQGLQQQQGRGKGHPQGQKGSCEQERDSC